MNVDDLDAFVWSEVNTGGLLLSVPLLLRLQCRMPLPAGEVLPGGGQAVSVGSGGPGDRRGAGGPGRAGGRRHLDVMHEPGFYEQGARPAPWREREDV